MEHQKTGKLRSRLGRGLSSLISVSEPEETGEMVVEATLPTGAESGTTTAATSGLTDLPIALIDANPHQPRRSFDEASLAELAASVKSTGLIQPIVVRAHEGRYQLIAGERRLRAAQRAELERIPAIVRESDDVAQAQMALVENIQRQDLNPIERAVAYQTLMRQLGVTQAELAGRLGEDRSRIAHYLRLLDLAPPVQELLRDGKVSLGHGKILAGVTDVVEQERLAKLVISQELTVRNLERLIAEGSTRPPADAETSKGDRASTAHLQQLEKSLSRQLGLRVQLKAGAKKGKGRLVIHYASLDQFDELVNRLGVSADVD